MLRWLCSSWGTFTASEIAAVEQLCLSHHRLGAGGVLGDLRSEAGYDAFVAYLACIDKTAQALGLEVAPRAYREQFSLNYKALFPDCARHLRVDVLEASIEQQSEIWVNGEQFELSADARRHAQLLQEAWAELGALLGRWHAAWAAQASGQPLPGGSAAAAVAAGPRRWRGGRRTRAGGSTRPRCPKGPPRCPRRAAAVPSRHSTPRRRRQRPCRPAGAAASLPAAGANQMGGCSPKSRCPTISSHCRLPRGAARWPGAIRQRRSRAHGRR
mmetsp:Transcript_160875/g.516309  ORF Transcript_160875/g.516309 Transcript_160875/m.516309 type:complete len:271 (-) Transcript_160875:107-919(-)